MKLTGAQALIKSLEMEQVEVVFGLPGGCILPAYDPILDSPIRHILVRHEQGAGHMAEGYAHVTGRPGRGHGDQRPGCDQPGHAALRRLHGLGADGRHHRPGEPTGDRDRRLPGVRHGRHHPLGDQAQRADHGARRDSPVGAPGLPAGHHRPARAGPARRARRTCLQAQVEWSWPTDDDVAASLPGYKPTLKGHPRMIKEAARLIAEARRPVIYAGGGILKSRAAEALYASWRSGPAPRLSPR